MKRVARQILIGTALVFVSAAFAGAQQTPQSLSLRQAIELALKQNVNVLTGQAGIDDAEGARERRRAALLPKVTANMPVAIQSRNLRAFGISAPGLPEVVGPFQTFDFRAYFWQPVVDLESYHDWESSEKQEQAARLDYQDTRDQVVRQVAGLYLNAESAESRVKSAQSRVDTAQALYELAQKQHDAGVATGVDVLRARVALANEEQGLLEERNSYRQALLALERGIGLDPGTPIELTQTLAFRPLTPPAIGPAEADALAARADYLALQRQRESLVEQQKANHARYLPALTVEGDWGGIGQTLGQIRQTGRLAATLRITLFNDDRSGERTQIDSRIARLEAQMADLRRGIGQSIRSALMNLETAVAAVSVAQQGADLARRELALARDRFRSGVTNNMEVITAQDAMARAQENYISALTQHEDAKIALARALGATERTYEQYLGVQ